MKPEKVKKEENFKQTVRGMGVLLLLYWLYLGIMDGLATGFFGGEFTFYKVFADIVIVAGSFLAVIYGGTWLFTDGLFSESDEEYEERKRNERYEERKRNNSRGY